MDKDGGGVPESTARRSAAENPPATRGRPSCGSAPTGRTCFVRGRGSSCARARGRRRSPSSPRRRARRRCPPSVDARAGHLRRRAPGSSWPRQVRRVGRPDHALDVALVAGVETRLPSCCNNNQPKPCFAASAWRRSARLWSEPASLTAFRRRTAPHATVPRHQSSSSNSARPLSPPTR